MADTVKTGIIFLKIDGRQYRAKGNYTVNEGGTTRASILGADEYHGTSETPQAAFVEGAITDSYDTDLSVIKNAEGVTVTVEFNNGKVFVLSNGTQVGDGNLTTQEGEFSVRFEGARGEFIR